MCGRAAQTRRALRAAEDLLLGHAPPSATRTAASRSSRPQESARQEAASEFQDNYNMSPGMSCTIFFRDDNNTVQEERKVWGLVPSGGTAKKPLPAGMTLHFEKLMFNARSDTLLDKRTFAPLFNQGRTCVIVVDGFFEWKPPALKGDKKQPYFVYPNKEDEARPFLMFAGLWTSVPTGRMDEPTLDTFTIITTEACPALEWLHSRMPLTIYDENLAREWLERPSRKLFKQLDEAVTPPDFFQWHAVTTEMSSTKYRSQDAIKALPPRASVKSFFSTVKEGKREAASTSKNGSSLISSRSPSKGMSAEGKSVMSSLKRSPASVACSSPAKKQKTPPASAPAKRGSIESFFSPKPKK